MLSHTSRLFTSRNAPAILVALLTSVLVAACGGGSDNNNVSSSSSSSSSSSGSSSSSSSSYTISGTVTGLNGSGMMVQTNGGHTVAVTANGTVTLATLPAGTVYTVTVSAQPTVLSQTCTVTNPSNTLNANVTLGIACVTNTYTISAHVTGLSGASTGVVLALNGTSNPVIHASATVALTPVLASGATYTVTVPTQPSTPSQTCTPVPNTGPVTNAPITVNVTCVTTTGTVGGTISGLNTATGLVLKDTVSGNTVTVPASSTTFAITPAVNSGSAYTVVVMTQPSTPAEYCTVAPATASGTVTTGNVTSVTIACRKEGRFAFVADSGGDDVASFAIDDTNTATAGTLTPINTAALAAGSDPVAIAVNPAGTFAFTADNGTGDVSTFSIAANGAVTFVIATPTGVTGSTPTGIAVDPSGNFLLVSDSASFGNGVIVVYEITPVTGVLVQVASSPNLTALVSAPGAGPSSVTVDPLDKYVFATNQFAPAIGLPGWTFDDTVGSGTLTPFTPWQQVTDSDPIWVSVDPLDRFVYTSNGTSADISAWTIGAGGVLTAIAGSPFATGFAAGASAGDIAIDPSGQFLFVTDSANGEVVAYTINQTTGVLTPFTTGSPFSAGAGGGAFPISIDPSGHFLYVGNTFADTISMYTVNTVTGALTPITGSPLNFAPGLGPNAIAIE
jgi:6-phosphogluconolactonase (cycloisomerase 2 family)